MRVLLASSWALPVYAALYLASTTVTVTGFTSFTTTTTPRRRTPWALCMAYDRSDTTTSRRSPYVNPNGHDYERDTSSDASLVDDGAVNGLLGERLRARKKGDFETADRIREQLLAQHQVTVFDKDKIWVTGHNNNNVEQRNRGGRFSDRRRDSGGNLGRGGTSRGPRRQRDFRGDFGPTGHDYSPCTEAGPTGSSNLSESEIHAQIAKRLMAKMNRDFDTADRVQLQLAEEGVYINDRTKEWRADGVRFIDPSEGRKQRQPSDRNRPYVQSQHSLPLTDGMDMDKIAQLVAERANQKRLKNFQNADSIRDGLLKTFDVAIDDRTRQWSIGGSFGKEADLKRAHAEALKSRGYVQSSASLDLPDGVTHEDVQSRVDARMRLKVAGQYQESDALRDEIKEEFGVVIHDKIKMWSVGGDFGMDDPEKAKARALSTYTRRGGGDLSDDDLEQIQAMLKERFQAKKVRNFEAADEIRAQLYDTYNVNINDKTREWRVLGDHYVQIQAERGAQELTGEDLSMVESIILRRAVLKNDKSYEEADAMRELLQSKYSVLVDDKTKEWKVTKFVPGGSYSSSGRSSPYKNEKLIEHVHEVVEEEELVLSEEPTLSEDVEDELESVDSQSDSPVEMDTPEEESTASPPPSILVFSRDDLTSLTVPLLKEKLRKAGKPVSGKKAELIDRLLDEE